jgi:hypothetical protein
MHDGIGVFRHENYVPVFGPLEGPGEDGNQMIDSKEADHHPRQRGGGALDEHPPQIFQVLEKRFYSTTFNLFVGLGFVARFSHGLG